MQSGQLGGKKKRRDEKNKQHKRPESTAQLAFTHNLHTNHRIDWNTAKCVTYSTDYYKRLTLESWFTDLEQTPLNDANSYQRPTNDLFIEQTNSRLNSLSNLTNNTTKEITLTIHGSKHTNH